MPINEEKICREYGVEYHYISAHGEFELGRGYYRAVEETSAILAKGNTLIHCTAGKDRTGYTVAAWLMKDVGMSKGAAWDYTRGFNNWEKHVCNPPPGNLGYIKYLDSFYPVEEFYEDYPEYGKCRGRKLFMDEYKKD